MKRYGIQTVLVVVLLVWASCSEEHENLQLNQAYSKDLTEEHKWVGRYVFGVPQEAVDKLKGSKWFFFVDVEPEQTNEWISTLIKISIAKKGQQQSRNERLCGTIEGGVDSCFFTNKQFDYKTEEIHVNVRCMGNPCKFKISAEISEPYKMKVGENINMDFENTAYSKVFQLDTRNRQDFDQLRVILRPEGFLKFAAPIGLWVNKGHEIPTKKEHDFASLTLWDNGEGVFIDMPDAQGEFTILVEGPQKNVLILQTETILFKDSYTIDESLPHFDYLGEGDSRFYKCKINPEKGTLVRFSTFSGSIKLAGIYDNKMKEVAGGDAQDSEFPPLQRSFSEMEYQLTPTFFIQNKKFDIQEYLIFEIEGVKESTFLFEYYELNKGFTHLIPEVNRYVELPSQEFNQYYAEVIQLDVPEFKKAVIEVIITHEETKPLNVRFFKCEREEIAKCELTDAELKQDSLYSFDGITEVKENFREVYGGGVNIYRFDLASKLFTKAGNDIKKYVLGVIVQNKGEDEQLYTIRFSNVGHTTYLKEKELQTDRIQIDQSKYYLFTNRHADVTEIRIHVVEISGRVKAEGFYGDPRSEDLAGQEIYPFHNAVRYSNIKENQTIFIKLTGKEMAFYSLQVQLIKESQRQWWKRRPGPGPQPKGFNEVVIFEGIPYEFSIEPNDRAVYQLHTKETRFYMEMSSLLPVEICMTQELTKAPFPPNCQQTITMTSKQLLDVLMERGKIGNIGVANNNNKTNKFNIKFYAQDKAPETNTTDPKDDISKAKCLPALTGKVTKYLLKPETSSCYTFFINSLEDTQFIIDVVSDQYGKVNVLAAVGEVERVEIIGEVHLFKKKELEKACGRSLPCTMKVFIDSEISSEVRFTLQPLTGTVYLLDGIANEFSGSVDTRYFAYELYNKINTTLVLENKYGNFKFYGSVVQSTQFFNQKVSHPTAETNQLESANPYYSNYNIAILSEKQILDSKCKECLLLVTVERQKQFFEDKYQFVIEVTQEDRFLKEKSPLTGYLNKHSISFYEVYADTNGSMLISLNTQNQQCASIYAKRGEGRASANDYDYSSHSNSLLIEQGQQKHLSVTVQATDNCYYTIDYTMVGDKMYSPVERGLFVDVKLQKNEEKKLLYKHQGNDSFRILTLHQSGTVTVRARTYKNVKQFMEDNGKSKYTWSGQDFLRVDSTDKAFCSDCVYLIVLSAERQTQTSVMIPSASSEFPIVVDSLIKQELKKGEKQQLRVYTQKSMEFEINVQYGSVNISLYSQNNDDKLLFSKIYKANTTAQYQKINNTKEDNPDNRDFFYYITYTKIIITAQEDTGFTFGLISNEDQSQRNNQVRYGMPEYITLEKEVQECLYGKIDNAQEEFLISITGEQQLDLMNNLEISCKLADKQLLQLSKNIAKNEMIVTIDKAPRTTLPANYELCLTSKDATFLTFIQSSGLLYLPENTNVVVAGTTNFTFYSEGSSLLQINECKSRAITTIYSAFEASDKLSSQVRQVRKTNNLVEFMYFGPVYVQVRTKSGTVSWRKKSQATNAGHGYEYFAPSKLRYEYLPMEPTLRVQVFRLKQTTDSAPLTFSKLTYTIYIAAEEMDLYDAINCHNGLFLSSSQKTHEKTDVLQFKINVQQIQEMFAGRRYVLIGALVNGTSSIEGDGSYRFVYPYQELPLALLRGEVIVDPYPYEPYIPEPPRPTSPEKESSTLLTILAYIVIGLFVTFGVYACCLKKCLKKRRIKRLSEQGMGDVQYQQFASYTT